MARPRFRNPVGQDVILRAGCLPALKLDRRVANLVDNLPPHNSPSGQNTIFAATWTIR